MKWWNENTKRPREFRQIFNAVQDWSAKMEQMGHRSRWDDGPQWILDSDDLAGKSTQTVERLDSGQDVDVCGVVVVVLVLDRRL